MTADVIPFERRVVEEHDPGAGKMPPHDLESEAAVIAAAFANEAHVARVADFLRPEHFYANRHSRIWAAILAVCAEPLPGQPCRVRVAARLRAEGRLEQVGGIEYLHEIWNGTPGIANVLPYAVIVHDRWRARQLIAAWQRNTALAYQGVTDVQAFGDRAMRELGAITSDNPIRPVETIAISLARILKAVTSPASEAPVGGTWARGYPTGLATIDRLLGGLAPGQKFTVAAGTGVGKTAFASQAAVHVAKQGVGVSVFSTEVTKDELLERMLACEAGVSSDNMNARNVTTEEVRRLTAAAQTLAGLPLWIDDTPAITVETIRSRTMALVDRARLVSHVPLGLVVADYVQRFAMRPDLQRLEERQQYAHSTKALKLLAQELRVAVLELAQSKSLSAKKGAPKKKPTTDDVFGTSVIAKEADKLMFLVATGKLESGAIDVTAYVPKQRGGKKDLEISLEYHGASYSFEDPNDPMRCGSRDFLEGLGIQPTEGT